MGITMGAHRYFTHRSYKAKLWVKVALLLFHTMAGQNCIYIWVRDHRQHHKYSDTDADPHNATRGFFFSHCGWLMSKKHPKVSLNILLWRTNNFTQLTPPGQRIRIKDWHVRHGKWRLGYVSEKVSISIILIKVSRNLFCSKFPVWKTLTLRCYRFIQISNVFLFRFSLQLLQVTLYCVYIGVANRFADVFLGRNSYQRFSMHILRKVYRTIELHLVGEQCGAYMGKQALW